MRKVLIVSCLVVQALGVCIPPETSPHSTLQCSKINSSKKKCTIQCDDNYFRFGPAEITCRTRNGNWTRELGECQRCPRMARPLFGSIVRTEHENGDVTYRFTCDRGTDLIGPAEITCSYSNRRWNHEYPPICLPDYAKCGKKKAVRCPKLTKKLEKEASRYKKVLGQEKVEKIQQVINDINRQLVQIAPIAIRGNQGISHVSRCILAYCKIKCLYLNKQLFSTCMGCKKMKVIRCNRKSGKIFGK